MYPKKWTEKNVHPSNGVVKYNETEGCAMGRTRWKFTEEKVRILAKNTYTFRVMDSTIRFTLSFKKELLRRAFAESDRAGLGVSRGHSWRAASRRAARL